MQHKIVLILEKYINKKREATRHKRVIYRFGRVVYKATTGRQRTTLHVCLCVLFNYLNFSHQTIVFWSPVGGPK